MQWPSSAVLSLESFTFACEHGEPVDLQLQCLVYSDAVVHVSNVVFYDML